MGRRAARYARIQTEGKNERAPHREGIAADHRPLEGETRTSRENIRSADRGLAGHFPRMACREYPAACGTTAEAKGEKTRTDNSFLNNVRQ